jgi:hypothetical protein
MTMRWTVNITERWADLLRFAVKAAMIFNGIMLAAFSVWFTAIFLWRLLQFVWKAWLGHRW